MNKFIETIIEKSIILIAFSTVAVLFLIAFFIFKEGIPFLAQYGLPGFLTGSTWLPGEDKFGILPMIIGSIYVTLGALIVGVPLGVGSAIFLVEFANKRIRNIIKPAIELLAGIPSVVYGFIGIMVLAPWVRINFGGSGLSILTASIVLGIMILPTIISITMDSLTALPSVYKEGSIALGATTWQTVIMVLLPGAKSGILAGIILGMGRAIGETMAVIMITGNAIRIPTSLYDSVRTMTSNIALEMGYALGIHRSALFANAVVLFGFIMILNTIAILIINKRSK
ncbi:phosphate ABC transporter permease subunit PstC [Candidatus Gottesmanbacteria bacterium RIFCSPLOWO2_01_FULL_39_12b]|uniref:Phosphate transport system permease protein n=1 Tax=Candidatus Gottesmanbacteria bacterium RIFCSPLOWO2_01_FULL_39_12b TaxID=1798388 RepID=A0A1F6AQ79_9BACT|nr:MAG: phosphate ABC transporter permease subunit PstC [Candidatus Gottesmanbacteria bacterium RIFCSPLOWO2_01_FULL_39_12b]